MANKKQAKTYAVDRISGTRFKLPDNPDYNKPNETLNKWMKGKDIENIYYEYE